MLVTPRSQDLNKLVHSPEGWVRVSFISLFTGLGCNRVASSEKLAHAIFLCLDTHVTVLNIFVEYPAMHYIDNPGNNPSTIIL